MRIVFVGAVESSKILLETLIDMGQDIVGVVSNKDTGINADYVDLAPLCQRAGIDCLKINHINDEESVQFIKDKSPDIIYCFGFSELLDKEILAIPTKGVVGFHPSQLPKNRGRHPLIWALALGLKETASTFFYINEGVDEGAIISQKTVPIYYEDYAKDLYNRVLETAKEQVKVFTKELEAGLTKTVDQKHTESNVWRKRTKKDGLIDWRMSSESIYNLVRALSHPYVGAHFEHRGEDIKVWKVEEYNLEEIENLEPGKILQVTSDNTFLVKAGKGCIRVIESDPIEIKVGEYL